MQATVTVQYVNPPKGNGPGSIKDTQGNLWKVWPRDNLPFQQGQTYTIEYTPGNYQGRPDNVVNGIVVNGGGAAQPAQYAQPQQPQPQHLAPKHDDQAESIFVTGVVGRAMGSGQFSATDISFLTAEAVAAYRGWKNNTLGLPREPQPTTGPVPTPGDPGWQPNQ